MKIFPLASDSLGVRSMATMVETGDVKIFIDPSAALGPTRYGLSPHPQELRALQQTKKMIHQKAQDCDILIISHYHYDHYDPDETFYQGKTLYMKDWTTQINKSQHGRAHDFIKNISSVCTPIASDNTTHTIQDTTIMFSPPFFHGPANIPLGYVIMTTIRDGDHTLLHSSDVQGPMTPEATSYILKQKPDTLIMDGPPTLFLGWKLSKKNLESAQSNLLQIMDALQCQVILDHHLLRDLTYQKRFPGPYIQKTGQVSTFAEYQGKKNMMLEAHRKRLWEDASP